MAKQAKPYKEGKTWSMRRRVRGENLYVTRRGGLLARTAIARGSRRCRRAGPCQECRGDCGDDCGDAAEEGACRADADSCANTKAPLGQPWFEFCNAVLQARCRGRARCDRAAALRC